MRLTLRTLLAYMDDILDPSDQEELGRKIESSPFATELIHRSRDAVRRLRLSAPDPLAGSDDDIHGSDPNLDANTASEYLDNTLSPDGVADFERSCLEAGPSADMLLAEAASCHHVLTMVLGEPAEVDADLRQRMYALAQSPAAAQQLRVEPAHPMNQTAPQAPAAVGAKATAAPATVVARPSRIDPDEAAVPDYMLAAIREQRRRTRRMVAAFAAAMLVSGGAVWYFWPPGEVKLPDQVAQMGGADKISEGVEVAEEGTTGPAGTTGDVKASGAENGSAAPADEASEAPPFNASAASSTPAAPATGAATEPAAGSTPATPPVAGPPAPPAEVVASPPLKPPVESSTTAVAGVAPDATSSTPPALPSPPGTEGPAMAPPAAASAPSIATNVIPPAGAPTVPPAGAPVAGSTPGLAPPPLAGAPVVPPQGDPAADLKANPAATAVAKPKQIGVYLGNNDLLLQFRQLDATEGGWVRLAPRVGFVGGEQLLALPSFRTHVVLADVNAYLSDGAEINVIPPGKAGGDSPADFGLRIPYGQVIFNSGLNGNRIELSLVDEDRVVQLGPSSSLAIDVDRVFELGGSAKREAAPAIVTWYLTSGTATWGDGKSASAPATWTTARGQDSAAAAIDKLPEWVDHESNSPTERRGRERVAEALMAGELVNTPLQELSDPSDRRPLTEVRALAALCGAYVGQYDALVRSLGDVNQRASWKAQIEALRQAIARDPKAIEGIRQAFASERGQEAAGDLMEMLLGFDRVAVGTTREEVKAGALGRIIRWMNDDDLTHRVLASHDMNEITGTGNGTVNLGGYRPEHNAKQRERELRHYEQRLDDGGLMPKDAAKP